MNDPISDFTQGDEAAAGQLRRSLQVLADEYAGTPLGDQLHDVLTGRLGLRELASDPEFAILIEQGVTEFEQHWNAMTVAEREALAREVESQVRDSESPNS